MNGLRSETETKQLRICGSVVSYDVTNEGPVIILIHGWAGSRLHWKLAPNFLRGYKVVAPDLYGFGDSEEPLRVTIPDDYVDLVHMLIGELAVERCILVGHSVGGLIAASLVARFPEKVGGLVLIEAPVARELQSTCPVLLVFGDRESDMEGLSRLEVANAQRAYNPSAELRFIDHTGHNPMLERPSEFYAVLREFAEKKLPR